MEFLETVKDKIQEIAEKIKNDKTIAARFAKDPVSVVESLIGIDLPNDKIDEVVEAVKAKINLDEILDKAEGLGSIAGKLGGFSVRSNLNFAKEDCCGKICFCP